MSALIIGKAISSFPAGRDYIQIQHYTCTSASISLINGCFKDRQTDQLLVLEEIQPHYISDPLHDYNKYNLLLLPFIKDEAQRKIQLYDGSFL